MWARSHLQIFSSVYDRGKAGARLCFVWEVWSRCNSCWQLQVATSSEYILQLSGNNTALTKSQCNVIQVIQVGKCQKKFKWIYWMNGRTIVIVDYCFFFLSFMKSEIFHVFSNSVLVAGNTTDIFQFFSLISVTWHVIIPVGSSVTTFWVSAGNTVDN